MTDSKRYSSDLSQGGLEIPCISKFEGEKLLVGKVQKLGKKMHTEQQKQTPVSGVAPLKRKEFEGKENQPCGKKPCSETNVSQMINVSSIIRGEKLSDFHMSYAQKFLKHQFPCINGLAANCISDKDDNN